jgi:hypothetical protein
MIFSYYSQLPSVEKVETIAWNVSAKPTQQICLMIAPIKYQDKENGLK